MTYSNSTDYHGAVSLAGTRTDISVSYDVVPAGARHPPDNLRRRTLLNPARSDLDGVQAAYPPF